MRWILKAILTGLIGAAILAINLRSISSWLDYTGQEVTNAGLQICIFILLTVLIQRYRNATDRTRLEPLLVLLVILAVIREGSEIMIYSSSFTGNASIILPALLGSITGAGIGLSVGVLLYHIFRYISGRTGNWSIFIILALFGANMLSQATLMIIQADWLPAYQPVWNTSAFLPENALTAQLLYAVAGYEATPAPLQLFAYLGGFSLLCFLSFRKKTD